MLSIKIWWVLETKYLNVVYFCLSWQGQTYINLCYWTKWLRDTSSNCPLLVKKWNVSWCWHTKPIFNAWVVTWTNVLVWSLASSLLDKQLCNNHLGIPICKVGIRKGFMAVQHDLAPGRKTKSQDNVTFPRITITALVLQFLWFT